MRFFFLAASLAALSACDITSTPTPADTNQETQAVGVPATSVIVSADVLPLTDEPASRVLNWETEPAGGLVTISATPVGGEKVTLVDSVQGQSFIFRGHTNRRTYFTFEGQDGEHVTTALRVLPLEGGRNFRDLGGYAAEDGRKVRWGMLFRSGYLKDLTDADYQFIDDLRIGTVVDFRATEERKTEATDWRAGDVEFVAWDYSMLESMGSLVSVFGREGITPQDVTNMMAGFYKEMVYEHQEKYQELFNRLLTTDAPLAYHCSAGKDRTGVATALVLSALGVPRETIVTDYAMSERVVDYAQDTADAAEDGEESAYGFLAKLDPELVQPLMRSNPVYIEAALDELETDHGSVLGFIQTELGVSDEQLVTLRDKYLTR